MRTVFFVWLRSKVYRDVFLIFPGSSIISEPAASATIALLLNAGMLVRPVAGAAAITAASNAPMSFTFFIF